MVLFIPWEFSLSFNISCRWSTTFFYIAVCETTARNLMIAHHSLLAISIVSYSRFLCKPKYCIGCPVLIGPRTGADKQLGSWSLPNTWWLVKLIPLQGLANVPFGGFLTAMYEYLLEIQWYPPKVGYVNNWNTNANLCMISRWYPHHSPSIPQFFSLPLGAMLLSVWDSQSPSWRLVTLRVVTAPRRWRKRWTKAASQRGLVFFLQETHGNPLVYCKHANKSASFSVKSILRQESDWQVLQYGHVVLTME